MLVGTLEAVAGTDLEFFCVTEGPVADEVTLTDENQVVVTERIVNTLENTTHRQFILQNTMISDNGRQFFCSRSEVVPEQPGIVTIFCKLLHGWTSIARRVSEFV